MLSIRNARRAAARPDSHVQLTPPLARSPINRTLDSPCHLLA